MAKGRASIRQDDVVITPDGDRGVVLQAGYAKTAIVFIATRPSDRQVVEYAKRALVRVK